MTDMEKVINALGRCESYGYCKDMDCPYYKNMNCLELLRKDALILLKAQEPVKPIINNTAWPLIITVCGVCGTNLFCAGNYKPKYCFECGKAVKWNG